jgi:hypothetical protein
MCIFVTLSKVGTQQLHAPEKMPSHKSTSALQRRQHYDTLMPKLLERAVQEARRHGVVVDADFVDHARTTILRKLESGNIADRDFSEIVRSSGVRRADTADLPQAPAEKRRNDVAQPAAVNDFLSSQTPEPSASQLLLNTTKRQRQLLADHKWIQQAEDDRDAAAVRRVQERQGRWDHHKQQRSALDTQLDEHNLQHAAEMAARRKAQDDMTQAVSDAREEMRKERETAFQKAQREKAFRERQVKENEDARERQRVQEHNDQIRHMMLIQQEVQRQRDEEAAARSRQKSEWQKVLRENDTRLAEKAHARERQLAEDREFQRNYAENLDRQERERAEARARKEARAATFQQMANVVAQMHAKKVQNVDDKIQNEFEEQQRRSMEDERQRRLRAKQRIMETHVVLDQQQHEKNELKRQEREAARQAADAMAAQAQEAARQEAARKHAAKLEAARLKEFLTTQLQLQHFRETRPLETSIARPESRATTMFSPSRYSPSPKPTL